MFRDIPGWFPFVIRTLDTEGIVQSHTYFAVCVEHAVLVAERLNPGHRIIESGMLN